MRKSCVIPCSFIQIRMVSCMWLFLVCSVVSVGWCDCKSWMWNTKALLLASLLTLIVNVLVLVHLPVHVWMRVRVYIRVDLRVDLGSQSSTSLSQEQLLMGDVVLVRKTIFIPIGRLRRQRWAGSVTIGYGETLGRKGRGGWRRGAGAFRLAEPEKGGA